MLFHKVAGKSPSSVSLLDPPTRNTPSMLSPLLCGTPVSGLAFWAMTLSYLPSSESSWPQRTFLDASFYISSQEFTELLRRWLGRGARMKQTQVLSLKRRGFLIVQFRFHFLNVMWFLQSIWSWLPKSGIYDGEWLVWAASEIRSITRSRHSQDTTRYAGGGGK